MNYSIANYNWTKYDNIILLTNDLGEYCFLTHSEFSDLSKGCLSEKDEKFDMLLKLGFIYKNQDKYISDFKDNMANMKSCLLGATNLFIMVLTNACNQRCIYCQAGQAHTFNMSIEICKKAINLAVQAPVSHIVIEFQGGEPTLNPDALLFSIPYAKKVFKEHGKHVDFAIVTNITNPDEKLLRFLIEQDVHISTSLDGNRSVHEYNRPLSYTNKSSYDAWHEGINLYKALFEEYGEKPVISAIQTTTRKSLAFYKEIINEYVANGIDKIYLRPLTPLGCARDNWDIIGYSPEEYVDFYCKSLDYMIEKCKNGEYISEATASIYLTRILNKQSVGHTEFRSPCGAAVGQLAVNYDGNVYTCDEGRMIANMGDCIFRLGSVDNTYHELLKSPVVHAVCTSSCVEALPMCSDCVYSPYCSVCPVINYGLYGDLIFKDEHSYKCVISKGILNYLFGIIKQDDPEKIAILQKWANN